MNKKLLCIVLSLVIAISSLGCCLTASAATSRYCSHRYYTVSQIGNSCIGYTIYEKCYRCQAATRTRYVNGTGHNWVKLGMDTSYSSYYGKHVSCIVYQCSRCGNYESIVYKVHSH